jgi:hypothetical protein
MVAVSVSAVIGPTPGTLINRLQTASACPVTEQAVGCAQLRLDTCHGRNERGKRALEIRTLGIKGSQTFRFVPCTRLAQSITRCSRSAQSEIALPMRMDRRFRFADPMAGMAGIQATTGSDARLQQ